MWTLKRHTNDPYVMRAPNMNFKFLILAHVAAKPISDPTGNFSFSRDSVLGSFHVEICRCIVGAMWVGGRQRDVKVLYLGGLFIKCEGWWQFGSLKDLAGNLNYVTLFNFRKLPESTNEELPECTISLVISPLCNNFSLKLQMESSCC